MARKSPSFSNWRLLVQQHIVHKGADADSLFLVLRGEAQECVRIMLHEQQQQHSDMGSGVDETPRSVQHCVTVQLTFLGKFDVAGEYLAAEKKVVTCPIDIRAVTDVDCLVLNVREFVLLLESLFSHGIE
jgi:hypothetical protein